MTILVPLLVPLFTALLTALLATAPRARRATSLVGALLQLAGTLWLLTVVLERGRLAIAIGGWPAPYGIELVAEPSNVAVLLAAALLGVAVLVATLEREPTPRRAATLEPLVHGLLTAVAGALLTADLFNLYVWFELMLMAVLGLLLLGGERRHLEAAMKYLVLSLLGTLLMLTAVALIYGTTGQLNFAALAQAARRPELADTLPLPVALLALALLLKAAALPLFFWLPTSYHTLPAPLLALVGGLVTKVVAFVLLRLFGIVFSAQPALFFEALGWLAVATMLSGGLGAAFHWDLRRILGFHIVSQIGYLLLAVALASAPAFRAGLFLLIHNILTKAALLLIAGIMARAAGHFDLRRIGGLADARPGLAALFLVAAFSLVGVPPSSGFWGKFLLVQEAFAQGRYVWGGFALAVGALTLYSMVKIWLEGFCAPHPDAHMSAATLAEPRRARGSYAAVIGLVVLLLALGLYPEPLLQLGGVRP